MALVTAARQKEREQAAKARKQTIEEENMLGLILIQAKKILNTPEKAQRKINKDKHLYIIQWVTEVNAARRKQNTDWNQPVDWRMVTATTLHQYIPFEKQNINLTPAHFLIGSSLRALPETDTRDAPINKLSRWQRVQQFVQHV